MREQVLGDADVVVDYFRLGEFRARIEKFIEARNGDAPASDS